VIKGAGSSRGRLVPDAIATVLTSNTGNDPSTVGAPNLSPLRSETNQIGALVQFSVRRIKVGMASACPAADIWGEAARRLAAASARGSPA
jgi:hypothetical protein